MAEEVRRDSGSRSADVDEYAHHDVTAELAKPQTPRDFTLRQDTLNVPKPSYYRHVDDGAELRHPIEHDGEEWKDVPEHDPAFEQTAAVRRARSSRIRWWGFLLFIFLYVAFKLLGS